jgi:Tol biopolymer transport system component
VVNSPSDEGAVSISADGLVLFFISDRPGGYGLHDIWVTWRTTTHDPWSVPVNLGPTVNTSSREGSPEISADGRELYFDDVGLPVWYKVDGFDLWKVQINSLP